VSEPDEDVCPGCEGEDESHDCGWVNEDCPEQCSMDHEADRDYVMECPVTGQHWRYCDRCGWEVVSRYSSDPYYIHGETLCDPDDHGFGRCEGCDDWHDQDYLTYSERSECYYCSDCYGEYGGGQGEEPGEDVRYCATCQTYSRNLNLLTEDFLCDHHAVDAHLRGVPVHFHNHDAALKVVRSLAVAA
jgi:hypothetical protein